MVILSVTETPPQTVMCYTGRWPRPQAGAPPRRTGRRANTEPPPAAAPPTGAAPAKSQASLWKGHVDSAPGPYQDIPRGPPLTGGLAQTSQPLFPTRASLKECQELGVLGWPVWETGGQAETVTRLGRLVQDADGHVSGGPGGNSVS